MSNIKIYTVSLSVHENHFDFEDHNSVIDNFLLNVKSKFFHGSDVFAKCGFSLENIHPAPIETEGLINDIQCWLTNVCMTKYFNDYLFCL